MHAEALEVIKSIIQGVNFQLATIAGSRINLADCQTAAKPAVSSRIYFPGKFS